jgi:anti-sigma B factor antagonist
MPHPETGDGWPASREGGDGLSITTRRNDAGALLRLDGELDLRTVPQLRLRLAETMQAKGGVVVDLTAVTFIDSTGLAALLNALRRLTRVHRRLLLVCGDGPVLRMLRLTRLDGTFTLCESGEAAFRTLEHAPSVNAA